MTNESQQPRDPKNTLQKYLEKARQIGSQAETAGREFVSLAADRVGPALEKISTHVAHGARKAISKIPTLMSSPERTGFSKKPARILSYQGTPPPYAEMSTFAFLTEVLPHMVDLGKEFGKLPLPDRVLQLVEGQLPAYDVLQAVEAINSHIPRPERSQDTHALGVLKVPGLMGNPPLMFNFDPEIRKIILKNPEIFIRGGDLRARLQALAGRSRLTTTPGRKDHNDEKEGKGWDYYAKITRNVTGSENVKARSPMIRAELQKAFASLKPGEQIAVDEMAQRITLGIIARFALGENNNATEELEPIWKNFSQLGMQFVINPLLPPDEAKWRDKMPEALVEAIAAFRTFLGKFVMEDRALKESVHDDQRSDSLVKELNDRATFGESDKEWKYELTQDEIIDQLVTLIFAGHDTSSFVMTMLLRVLAENEQKWAEIDSELEKFDDNHGDDKTGFPINTLNDKCPQTMATINEVLRIFGPVPALAAYCTQDVSIGGISFHKGDEVRMFNRYAAHSKDIWPQGAEFAPEKPFAQDTELKPAQDAELKSRQNAANSPWGEGPRKCPGLFLATTEFVECLRTLRQMGIKFKTISNQLAQDIPLVLGINLDFQEPITMEVQKHLISQT